MGMGGGWVWWDKKGCFLAAKILPSQLASLKGLFS